MQLDTNLTINGLVSGLVGSLFGISASFAIYHLSNWKTARTNLRAKLLQLCDTEFVATDQSKSYRALYETSFGEVWNLHLIYRDSLPFFCRGKVREGWWRYKGYKGKWPREIETFSTPVPPTEEQVQERVNHLINAIGGKS